MSQARWLEAIAHARKIVRPEGVDLRLVEGE